MSRSHTAAYSRSDVMYLNSTDPRSPQFQKTMLELQNQQIRKESNAKIIDNIIVRFLADKSLEDKELVEEKLRLAAESSQKYLEMIAKQEERKYQEALQQLMGLEQSLVVNRLRTQHDTLLAKRKELETQLERLPAIQQEIHEAWAKQQTLTAAKFTAVLRQKNITSIKGPKGVSVQLNDKDIEQLAATISSTVNPARLVQINPSLITLDEKEIGHRAKVMVMHNDSMTIIKAAGILRDRLAEEDSEISKMPLTQILRDNVDVAKAIEEAAANGRTIKIEFTGKALKFNTPFLEKQIELNERQIHVLSNLKKSRTAQRTSHVEDTSHAPSTHAARQRRF